MTYEFSSDEDYSLVRLKTHTACIIAPFQVFRKSIASIRYCRQALGNSNPPFTNFYLRDIIHKVMNTFSVSLVGAAQDIV